MTLLKITMDFFPLVGLLLVACGAGFLVRGGQLKTFRKKMIELEQEMVNNHAEILELQKEKALLLKQMKESKIPVISLRLPKEETDRADKKMAGQANQKH